jgi:hypothetical protein
MEFSDAMQIVLKYEWKRVKFGEPLYRGVFIVSVLGVRPLYSYRKVDLVIPANE